jgi:hypothetical protein
MKKSIAQALYQGTTFSRADRRLDYSGLQPLHAVCSG